MNGFIYKISSPDNKLSYYGLTTNNIFCRLNSHINQYRCYKNGSTTNSCASYIIFDAYGIDEIKIELIEKHTNITINFLLERERYYITNFDCVNISGKNSSNIFRERYVTTKKPILIKSMLLKPAELNDSIKKLFKLEDDNLNDFETMIAKSNKLLLKMLQFYIFTHYNIENNTFENTKIEDAKLFCYKKQFDNVIICKNIMKALKITDFNNHKKTIKPNIDNIIEDEWLISNMKNIKRIFDIRTNKYDSCKYYKIYLLWITIIKNLFDNNLFVQKKCKKKNFSYITYFCNPDIINKYNMFFDKFNK